MALSDIVELTISSDSVTPTREGFGTILALCSDAPGSFTNRVMTVADQAEAVSAGFSASGVTYKLLGKIKSQNPAVPNVKLGRRLNKPVQSISLTVLSAAAGAQYSLKVNNTQVNYTVPGSSTLTSVATAIASLIDADSQAVASSSSAVITVTAGAAGVLNNFSEISNLFSYFDNTPDPGIVADLNAILAEDPDFYGVALDSNSKAEILAAAAWAESNKKFLCVNSTDSDVKDSVVTTDVFSMLKAANYEQTIGIYSGAESLSFIGAAAMGDRFPFPPGSYTWKFKSFNGVSTDKLTTTERNAVLNKNGNVYITVIGVPMLEEGKMFSGEFADNVRGLAWLESEIKISVFAGLAGPQKVPFTGPGVTVVEGLVKAPLQAGVDVGFVNEGFTVSVPKVSAVGPIDKANRRLTPVKFSATYQGAIHKVTILGTVTP